MANILLLLVIVMIMFAVAGVTVFSAVVPEHFGDLQDALFSMFICITQDGWVSIFHTFKVQGGWVYIGGMIYFFLAITLAAFIFANLIVAVIVTNLEMAMSILTQADVSTHKSVMEFEKIEDSDAPRRLVQHMTFSKTMDYSTQKPLQYVNLKNLTVDHVTKYYMLLIALDENLAEYKSIRNMLEKLGYWRSGCSLESWRSACKQSPCKQSPCFSSCPPGGASPPYYWPTSPPILLNKNETIYNDVVALQMSQSKTTESVLDYDSSNQPSSLKGLNPEEILKDLKGDMLSNLITLEQHRAVNSSKKEDIIGAIRSLAGEEYGRRRHKKRQRKW